MIVAFLPALNAEDLIGAVESLVTHFVVVIYLISQIEKRFRHQFAQAALQQYQQDPEERSL